MEAARVSALRGHKVTLFEKKDRIGGALIIGGIPSFKKDDLNLVAWYEQELKRLGVEVLTNTEADKDAVDAIQPDVIYAAEGSVPIIPNVHGVENAVLAQDILTGKVPAKENVILVGGGLVGCETALHLAMQGKNVTM